MSPSILKKAISVGISAALLASLVATIAAPAAFGAITITSAGNVPVGGTSASTVTFQFTEQAIASLTNAPGSFQVTITPAAPGAGSVTFSGTASTAGSTGSLGASAVAAGNVLTVSFTNSDTLNIESIFVTGLSINAAAGTSPGAINAVITAASGQFANPAAVATAFAASGTATGYVSNPISAGATSVVVTVTSGTCIFTAPGTLAFATNPDGSVAISAVSAEGVPVAGEQTLTIAATSNAHLANELVSESTACAATTTLASPGTVVAALAYSSVTNSTVYPGEDNSPAANLTLVEPSAGFLALDSYVTYTIQTAGFLFSTAPTVAVTLGNAVVAQPTISAARTSATFEVTTASTVASTFVLSNILYDVSASATPGTFVTVGVTTSTGVAVNPTTNTNAVVFRGVLGASATTPTVYIGQNDQTAGIVTFKESAAGWFTAGLGTGTNTFEICPSGVGYSFTLAPYAEVVGGVAAGNLILRDGNAASATNIVQGTNLGNGCYGWTVWTASTVASTIEIGSAGLTSGALINVTPAQAPGGVNVALSVGSSNFLAETLIATVQFATAVYQNQVAVTALSQPVIAVGSTHAAGGNLQIAETAEGQLKAGENICVEVLFTAGEVQTQFLNGLNTADLPVATASGTGLVIGPVQAQFNESCNSDIVDFPNGYMTAFVFPVLQQSTAGDGKIVISNISYTTLSNSSKGPVQLSVWGLGGAPTSVIFHSTVSDAIVGFVTTVVLSGDSSLSASGPWTTATKILKVGQSITIRIRTNPSMAGTRLGIFIATKGSSGWSAYKPHTSVTTDVTGTAWYTYKFTGKHWLAFRAYFAGNQLNSPAWSVPAQFGRAI